MSRRRCMAAMWVCLLCVSWTAGASGEKQYIKENPNRPELDRDVRKRVRDALLEEVPKIPNLYGPWDARPDAKFFGFRVARIVTVGTIRWQPQKDRHKSVRIPAFRWDHDAKAWRPDGQRELRLDTGGPIDIEVTLPSSSVQTPQSRHFKDDWETSWDAYNYTAREADGTLRKTKKENRTRIHTVGGGLKGFTAEYQFKETDWFPVGVEQINSSRNGKKTLVKPVGPYFNYIKAVYRYDGFRWPIFVYVSTWSPASDPRDQVTRKEIDAIAGRVIDIVAREANIRLPQRDPDPAPRPRTDPEPEPEPEPAEVATHTPRRPTPEPRRPDPVEVEGDLPDVPEEPDRPDEPAAERIEQMDGMLDEMEDDIQGALLLVKKLTQQIEAARTAMLELRDARREFNQEATKAKAAARIKKYIDTITELSAARAEIVAGLRKEMNAQIARVEKVYNEYGFGELDFAAATRVEAVKSRRTLMDAQLALLQHKPREAMAVVRRMREDPTLTSASYYIEAMSLQMQGRPIDALDAIRQARRRGLTKSIGGTFAGLERSMEIHILRQIQRLTSNESARFRDEFEDWIASKAETERDPNKSMFGKWVTRSIWRGWYDTVSGVTGYGGAAAEARAEEMGTVVDDMSLNHRGIGIIIGLRQHHSLAEIRDMTAEQFEAAVRERWRVNIDKDKLQKMRQIVRHAFQMDDMKVLASDQVLIEGDVLSEPLVRRIKSESILETSAEYGASGGNMISGWTMLVTLAPGARLAGTGYAGTGLSAGTSRAAAKLKNARALKDWFSASAPVTRAAEMAQKWGPGKKAAEAMVQFQAWSQRSAGHTVTAMLAEAVASSGASYAARRTLGEEAALMVDAFTALGGGSADAWADAVKKLDMTADRARAIAGQMRRQAYLRGQSIRQLDQPYETVKALTSGESVDPATLRRTLAEAAEAPAELRTQLEAAAELAEAGETAAARQVLRDFERSRDAAVETVLKTSQASDVLERSARRLPTDTAIADQSVINRTRRANEQLTREVASVRSGTDVVEDVAGDIADDVAGAGTVKAPRPEAIERGADQWPPPGVRGKAANRLAVDDPADPLHTADKLLSQGKPGEAILEYHRVSLIEGVDDELQRQINRRLTFARQVKRERVKLRRLGREVGPPPPAPDLSPTRHLDEVAQASKNGQWDIPRDMQGKRPTAAQLAELGQPQTPHVVPVSQFFKEAGERGTAAAPVFVYGHNGKLLGVRKSATGMADHPDGIAEELASRINETVGRPGAKVRVHEMEAVNLNTGRVARERFIVTELMPQGRPLADVATGPHSLLAHQEVIAEDAVFSMLMGDGDRHFGNYWLTDHGELIPYDYGLADLFPDHPYRFPGMEGQKNRVGSLYRPEGFEKAVPHTSPEFEDFVRQSMKRHWNHGTRSWRRSVMGDQFAPAMTYEAMKPHIDKYRKLLEPTAPGGPSKLSKMLDETMGPKHPHREYTEKLLETRLKVMGEFLKNPDRVPGGMLPGNSRLPHEPGWLRRLPLERLPIEPMRREAA